MKNRHSEAFLEKRRRLGYPILVVNDLTKHRDVFPRIIQLEVTTKETSEWLIRVHEERKKYLEKELLKVQLKIHALETDDYSMLSQELIQEIKEGDGALTETT